MGSSRAVSSTSILEAGHNTSDPSLPKRTPIILLWAFNTLIWSIFTPPNFTFAARILLFQPSWALRIYIGDKTWVQDLTLFLGLHSIYSYIIGGWRFVRPSDFWWLDFHNRVFILYLEVFALLGICGVFAGGIVYRGHQLRARAERDGAALSVLDETIEEEQLLPPLLIPSRTTHERLIPKRHRFSYSYLLVGIPVGIRGRVARALSVDDGSTRGWFHVDSTDYLAREGRYRGLSEKLKRYLQCQGKAEREYSFAYLVTAPRFLGYSFNPISFWYLYDGSAKLKYMVLEVNNTFGERRMYLLRLDETKPATTSSSEMSHDDEEEGAGRSHKTFTFTNTWAKDFHVSPFNDRGGSYSLRAVDPLIEYQEKGQVRIDNTIVLRTPDSEAKIVARICSRGEPQDATMISTSKLAKFVISWWWVGLLTFPRIIWEARTLFFQKRLRVWYRPEVVDTSISRAYTDEERIVERFFRSWLTHVVEHAQVSLRLIYEPAHHDDDEIVLYSPNFVNTTNSHERTLTVRILTPAFYHRFVHYAHAAEAFDRECLATGQENRTFAMENANLLRLLLEAIEADADARRTAIGRPSSHGALRDWRWSLQQRLRCPPAQQSYPRRASDPDGHRYRTEDIRAFGPSELDLYVRTAASASSSTSSSSSSSINTPSPAPKSIPTTSRPTVTINPVKVTNTDTDTPARTGTSTGTGTGTGTDRSTLYLRTTSHLFLAQRFTGGIPFLLDLIDLILRATLLMGAIWYCHCTDAGDMLRPRWMSRGDIGTFAGALALANAVHLWSFVKGVD